MNSNSQKDAQTERRAPRQRRRPRPRLCGDVFLAVEAGQGDGAGAEGGGHHQLGGHWHGGLVVGANV